MLESIGQIVSSAVHLCFELRAIVVTQGAWSILVAWAACDQECVPGKPVTSIQSMPDLAFPVVIVRDEA